MRIYSNVYNYAMHTLNYYEDKYFISLFGTHICLNFTRLLKISINNHTLLYIHINMHKYI